MNARSRRVPSYRLHKPTGQAVVRLNGHDHYLGRHGTEASFEAYQRKISEWLAGGRSAILPLPGPSPEVALTVNELILGFWKQHAEVHYRHADGTPTGELDNLRDALR